MIDIPVFGGVASGVLLSSNDVIVWKFSKQPDNITSLLHHVELARVQMQTLLTF